MLKEKSKRVKYTERVGYRYRRQNPYTDTFNVLYDAEKAGLDTAGGRWVTVCEKHGTLCNHRSLEAARKHLPYADWCEACMRIAEKTRGRK